MAAIPALITGFFSWQVATHQANGVTEERTNVTYDAISEAVEDLAQSVSANQGDVLELKRLLDELSSQVARSHAGSRRVSTEAVTLSTRRTTVQLPKNLDMAIELRRDPFAPPRQGP